MVMSELQDFQALLARIDDLLNQYDPGECKPDQIIGEIVKQRAEQRSILEEAVQLASDGLVSYPLNPQLLYRRAWARCRIVAPEWDYPELESAEQDLRAVLSVDPDNFVAGAELLDSMFTFSGMEDSEVADVARTLAESAEHFLLRLKSLQISALAYADELAQARSEYDTWIRLFPDSAYLDSAKKDIESLSPSDSQ